jgi:hypothetical protein
MYDEILGPVLKYPSQSTHLPVLLPHIDNQSAKVSENNNNKDLECNSAFSTVMIERLRIVESEAKLLRRQLAEKCMHIQSLESENMELKESLSDDLYLFDEIKALKLQNTSLQTKICDMEEFLSDYGLVWVGKAPLGNSANSESDEMYDDSEFMHESYFATFQARVIELNAVTAAEPTKILRDDKKARLVNHIETLEKIRVQVYRNGLMIRRGPFRPFNSPSCKAFMQDVIDGFFPSEFRFEYPDGVVIEVIDKHSEIFSDEAATKMSAAQLLDRMPKTIIKNGNIIDVSQDLRAKLTIASTTSSTSPGDNSKDVVRKAKIINSEKVDASRKQVQVQVKWIDGTQLLQIAMYESDTVQQLREEIIRYFSTSDDDGDNSLPSFEIRSAYPPRALAANLTMTEAGLAPNGTVHARKI